MEERKDAVTFKGQPLTLIGPSIKVGTKAPDATVIDNNLNPIKLSSFSSKVKIISSVPSLDTPVCDMETRKFNESVKKLGPDVVVLTVSMDLPFAQKRWCGVNNVSHVVTLSDYKDTNFGQNYGTLIKELRLESRAVFVVDKDNVVRYVEYVKEMTNHPNYDTTFQAVEQCIKKYDFTNE
jgi:thiol peroxidase